MKIDYASIIQKADQRREKLQRLEAFLDNVEVAGSDLLGILKHFEEARLTYYSLDAEGKQVLGNTAQVMERVFAATSTALRALSEHERSGSLGIVKMPAMQALIDAARGTGE